MAIDSEESVLRADMHPAIDSNHLISALNSVSAGVLFIDRNMQIVWHNFAASELAKEPILLGECCYKIFYGESSICSGCKVKRTFETGHAQSSSRTRFIKGSPIVFNTTTIPILDDDGNIFQVMEIIHDITATRKAESELANYKKLVNNSDDLMTVIDRNGSIFAVNRKMTGELGYECESELIGLDISEMISADENHKCSEVMTHARTVGLAMASLSIRKKDGCLIPTQAMVVYDEEPGVFEIIFRDISERLRMTDELRKRSEEIQTQNRQILAVIEKKNRFFRSVSHELRTPLTSVIGFAELMLEDTEEPLTDRQRMQMERVAGNAHKLLGLVSDLLDLSKIESYKVELHQSHVDIREFLNNAAANLMPLARDKSLMVSVEIAAGVGFVMTDEEKLGQIIVNLVSNAIKFTSKGRIDILAQQIDDIVRITVSDTGVGISPDDLPEIFNEFYQCGRQSPGQRGTGLGLAIAHKLASLLGGHISVASELGKGSTFTLDVPALNPKF